MIYSRVTCSKCQQSCWNIAYLGGRVVCTSCLAWFGIGNPWVRGVS